ncbi:hypothetical protein MIND_00177700 [Mycena indigotica]|uniref:Peptidase A2 domain-containing protein n=1 Tax=Mycena indigotica TaxID=2126181 RepID=A0A8H6TG11_9AGAR|nr:uncharacterized protein MIND_00177700 [Mycena indigotica]KAF7316579.1 hypothetical protein MIND_00177700 [Mycena indigotica]
MLTFVKPLLGTEEAVKNFYQLAMANELSSYESDSEISDVDSGYTTYDDTDGTIYLSIPKSRDNATNSEVYGADRQIPSTRTARNEVSEGNYSPHRTRAAVRNEDIGFQPKTKPFQDPAPVSRQSPPKPPPRPPTPPVKPILKPVVEIPRRPRTQASEIDIEMPDAKPIRSHTAPLPRDPNHGPKKGEKGKDKENRLTPIRQSAISSTVNRSDVTNRILDTKVEVSLRELMEVSKDVRTEFTDMVKVKNPKAVLMSAKKIPKAIVGNYAWPRMDGVLIKVDMVTNGSIITAIIDTGSQLNVVRGDLARQRIKRVVDTTRAINMNDANGGSGQLCGIIRGAELICGGLHTTADLWVSEKAPFELLLGRPWQRANKVSIDERREGTYLVFKDARTDQPRLELLAATPEDNDFEHGNSHFQSLACLGLAPDLPENGKVGSDAVQEDAPKWTVFDMTWVPNWAEGAKQEWQNGEHIVVEIITLTAIFWIAACYTVLKTLFRILGADKSESELKQVSQLRSGQTVTLVTATPVTLVAGPAVNSKSRG